MRFLSAIKSDIIFQFKQGFYIIYIVITFVYMIALSWIPSSSLKIVVPLVIFSDPSVIGLFFVGGIVMLEKTQGIIYTVVVTPLRTREYILSKVISLVLVSLFAGVIIVMVAYKGVVDWLLFFLTLILTASFFTFCGLIVGATCNTINQYIVRTIPIMLFFIIPCFTLISFQQISLFELFPSVAALKLMIGAFIGIDFIEGVFLLIYLLLINVVALKYTESIFEKYVVYGG